MGRPSAWLRLSERRRAGIGPRRQARRITVAALCSPTMLVTVLVAGAFAVALTAGLDAFFSIGGRNIGPAFRWFVIGAVLASVPWTVWSAVTQADGSWAWRTGAEAERWTAAALRHLGRDWHFHYNVVFYGGKIEHKSWVSDIDCVAIGPGGVFCVSTKWTSDRWDLDNPEDDWLVAAAAQAARNAGRLAGPARQAVPEAELTPVVVCWGPQLGPVKEVVSKVRAQGTEAWVVYGPQSKQWLGALRGTGASGPVPAFPSMSGRGGQPSLALVKLGERADP